MVDGTQDGAGIEQESICIRYVDKTLVNEMFLGLYNPPDTTGITLSVVVKDVLTRITLPIEDLRAQTYDGAANMSGEYNGCQAIIGSEYTVNRISIMFEDPYQPWTRAEFIETRDMACCRITLSNAC